MHTDNNKNPLILFDGVCNFCNAIVNFLIRNDKKGKLKFVPLQSPAGVSLKKQYNISDKIDSVILIDKGNIYTHAAAIKIYKYLDWPAKALYVFNIFPLFITNKVYKWVAANRYKWFGKKEQCMVPDAEVRSRFLL